LTGAQVSGANSYVSVATLQTYASDRGITISGTEEDLLIQAMDYIESLDYIGYKLTDTQTLQWPRGDAKKDKIYWYDTNEIPQELIDALCEVALAVDAGNSPLANLDRATKREKVGDLEIEYKDSAASQVVVKKINAKLRKLLHVGYGAAFTVGKA
jgi:hypothetical protein